MVLWKKHSSRRVLCVLLLQLILLTEFTKRGTLCKTVTSELLRNSRSIKTYLSTISKGGRNSQTSDSDVSEMSDKIAYLERSVKNITGHVSTVDMKIEKISEQVSSVGVKMDKNSEQTSAFQQLFAKQLEVMQELNGEVATLKQTLSGHGEILENLEALASPDAKIISHSSDICGGVLIGQSGSIYFTNSAFSGMGSSFRRPSTCVWTIRVKNRRALKIKTVPPKEPTRYSLDKPDPNPEAYLVEIRKKNDTGSSSGVNGSAANFETKLAKLEPNTRYTCDSPLVFVIYVLPTNPTTPRFQLEYEGMGKFAKESLSYSHENLVKNSGTFNIDQMGTNDLADENGSFEYTSIVIANFSTRAYLQADLDNETCTNKDSSFVVMTHLFEQNSTALTDCCRQSCMGKHSLISLDSPFIVLISKKAQAPLKFNMSWVTDTAYPSSSVKDGIYSFYKCGGVVGGSNGVIAYEPYSITRHSSKCIWTIIPQPRTRSSIEIEVSRSAVDSTTDHLYMMELTDVNGTELADGPKITHMKSYGTYTAHSSELYIVLSTGNSRSSREGFSLKWKSTGDVVRTARDVVTRFAQSNYEYGKWASLQNRTSFGGNLRQVFVVAPTAYDSNIYGMKLQINQTQPTPTSGGDCLHEDMTVYTAKDGLFRKLDTRNCSGLNESELGQVKTEIDDGMAMIVLNDKGPDYPFVAMNYSWKEEYGQDDDDYITVDNKRCGGVIKGDKGLLKYKLGTAYAGNERCVWLLQSPNHSGIKLQLLKDGFERCCDKIIVNTIDPSTGTIRNDTTLIDRGNNTKVFNESVLVIAFFSDNYSGGRGFALEFTGEGEADPTPEYSYQLHHRNEQIGSVTIPGSEWEDPVPGTKEILVTAVSYKLSTDVDSQSMSTNISFTSGVFKREHDGNEEEISCTYESLSFYTSLSRSGWRDRIRFPQDKDIASCPAEIVESTSTHVCSTKYAVFLALYRRITPPNATTSQEANDDDGAVSSRVGFSFHKSSSCGGVMIANSGAISYREGTRYGSNEKCVWLIEAPQAKRIQFALEDNGFEACCDFLYISTFSKDGTMVPAANITANSTSAIVDGPAAIVVFTSDSYVNKYGFVLRYSTIVNATEAFPYTFRLEHHHEPIANRFSFQVEEDELVVAAFSKATKSLDSWSYSRSSTSRVNVTALRPQLDETCHSDQLTFYNVLGKGQQLAPAKNFTALQILKGESLERVTLRNETLHEHCPPLTNSDFGNCATSIAYCTDKPIDNPVTLNGTSFVAVYKSVNVSTGDLKYRGFSILMYSSSIYNRYPYTYSLY